MSSSNKKSNSVFIISIVLTLSVVLWGLLSPDSFGAFASTLFNTLTDKFGWGYILSMNIFVAFSLFLAFSRFGKTKLGPNDSKPEFKNVSWFAMLFSAGMGVGLVFYGAAEPIFHFGTTPFGAEPGSVQAARDAIQTAFFHWGLHPWAGYSVIALSLAFFQFRKNAPGLISSVFLPILGEKGVSGPIGKAIDVLAIFATLAGITTSLGLGTMQLNSGLSYVFGLPKSLFIQIVIIAVLAVLYTGSAVLGIEKGIKKVADFNLLICALLMVGLFIVGPTIPIIEAWLTGIGDYLTNVISQSFTMAPYGGEYKKHLGSWTLYYWAWWIAWAPFVGSFVARISRGRTIREFVAGVLIVPALGSFTWFAIFGTSALHLEMVQGIEISKNILADMSTGVFEMYSHYPLGTIMSMTMVVLITTFFVTSANSGTFVLSMYSSQGDLNPPKDKMAIWGIMMAALAVVLLMTGGLQNLQTISLTAAPPFAIIMVMACYCLYKGLLKEEAEGKL